MALDRHDRNYAYKMVRHYHYSKLTRKIAETSLFSKVSIFQNY